MAGGAVIQIHEHKAGDAAPRWSAADRRLRVESELELALVNGCITHRPRAVRPYEKTYAMDDRHAPGSQVFVAHVHERPAGEIRLSHAWNGYACIHQLLVAHHHRRAPVAFVVGLDRGLELLARECGRGARTVRVGTDSEDAEGLRLHGA